MLTFPHTCGICSYRKRSSRSTFSGNQRSTLGSRLGNTFKVHSTSTKLHWGRWDVGYSSMPNLSRAAHGTSAPKLDSTLDQQWTRTGASGSSRVIPKARLSRIQLNSDMRFAPSRRHPQKIKSSMASRQLQVPSRILRFQQPSPNLRPYPISENCLKHGASYPCPPLRKPKTTRQHLQGCMTNHLQGWYHKPRHLPRLERQPGHQSLPSLRQANHPNKAKPSHGDLSLLTPHYHKQMPRHQG